MRTTIAAALVLCLAASCGGKPPGGEEPVPANKLTFAPFDQSNVTPLTDFTIVAYQVLATNIGEQPPPRLPSGEVRVYYYDTDTSTWIQAWSGDGYNGRKMRATVIYDAPTTIPQTTDYEIPNVSLSAAHYNLQVKIVHLSDGPGGAWLTSEINTWNPSEVIPETGLFHSQPETELGAAEATTRGVLNEHDATIADLAATTRNVKAEQETTVPGASATTRVQSMEVEATLPPVAATTGTPGDAADAGLVDVEPATALPKAQSGADEPEQTETRLEPTQAAWR